MTLKGDNKTALVTRCGGGFVVEWEKTVPDPEFPKDTMQERGSEVFKSWLDAAAFMRDFFGDDSEGMSFNEFEESMNKKLVDDKES